MSIKKRPQTPVAAIPGLDPAVEDLLVAGPSDDDEFLEFTLSVEEIRALVRTHAAALQAEAERRGRPAAWAAIAYADPAATPRRRPRGGQP